MDLSEVWAQVKVVEPVLSGAFRQKWIHYQKVIT